MLVLDDYHVIESPAVHRTLGFLLDYLPPGCTSSSAHAGYRQRTAMTPQTPAPMQQCVVEAGPEVGREAVIAAINTADYCEITVVETAS